MKLFGIWNYCMSVFCDVIGPRLAEKRRVPDRYSLPCPRSSLHLQSLLNWYWHVFHASQVFLPVCVAASVPVIITSVCCCECSSNQFFPWTNHNFCGAFYLRSIPWCNPDRLSATITPLCDVYRGLCPVLDTVMQSWPLVCYNNSTVWRLEGVWSCARYRDAILTACLMQYLHCVTFRGGLVLCSIPWCNPDRLSDAISPLCDV